MQKQKAIVTPDWLRESVKRKTIVECGDYAALPELHDETVKHCPEEDSSGPSQSQGESSTSQPPPIVKPTSPRIIKNWTARYACTRASPLTCVNQELAVELDILGQHRELESLSINALSYERSVAVCFPCSTLMITEAEVIAYQVIKCGLLQPRVFHRLINRYRTSIPKFNHLGDLRTRCDQTTGIR
jgi:hypothetical protein